MRAIGRRLDRLSVTIAGSPGKRHLLQEAYEWFTGFGELPPSDDQQLACEVVMRALRGGSEYPVTDEEAADIKRGVSFVDRTRKALESGGPAVRAMLFEEALFAVRTFVPSAATIGPRSFPRSRTSVVTMARDGALALVA